MGYSFTLDPPGDGARSGCAFNNWQMNYVRLVLVEAGAIAGNGLTSALRTPGLEPTNQTLPAATFMFNSGTHVDRAQAEFIAGRLSQALDQNIIGDLLSFLDDAPAGAEVAQWVQEFAGFNERMAEQDGYYVC
jgi:hypothetical protein